MCLSWGSSLNETDSESFIWKCQVTPAGPCKETENISALHICIAVLQHAEKIMGEWVCSEQKGDPACPTSIKGGGNYSSSRGWFRVSLACSLLRTKVLWPAVKQLITLKVRWSDFSVLFCQEEAEWPLSEGWLHWGFLVAITSSNGRLYRQLLDKLPSFLLTSVLQMLVLESRENNNNKLKSEMEIFKLFRDT